MSTKDHVMARTILVLIALLLKSGASVQGQEQNGGELPGKRLYVMSNQAEKNTVIVFERANDGRLTRIQEAPTGGLGSGPGVLPSFLPPGPGPNPLQSQNSLIATEDDRFLLAVNAGSNEISVLAVKKDGLVVTDKASSEGVFPITIASYKGLIYVINEGAPATQIEEPNGIPTMAGFHLDSAGRLHYVPGSKRVIGAQGSNPADVTFSLDGSHLIISEKFSNVIDVFPIQMDGRTGEPIRFPTDNLTPFGMAFAHHRVLAVTFANSFLEDGRRNTVPRGSTTATYQLEEDGALVPISGSVPNNQTASCWIRVTPNGRFAYVTSKGTGAISLYSVSPQGELTLMEEVAADTGQPLSGPIDLAITPDGRFLYVLISFAGAVEGYHIERDGSLARITRVDGFPVPTQGIVAF
jgi:6-phosphogluconolactonase